MPLNSRCPQRTLPVRPNPCYVVILLFIPRTIRLVRLQAHGSPGITGSVLTPPSHL